MPPPTLSQITLSRRPAEEKDEPPGIDEFEFTPPEEKARRQQNGFIRDMEQKADRLRSQGNEAGANRVMEELGEQLQREKDPEFGLFGTALIAHRARVRDGRRAEAREARQQQQDDYDEEIERRENRRNRPGVNDWTKTYTEGISPKKVNRLGESFDWDEDRARPAIAEYINRFVAAVFTDGKISYFVRKPGGEKGYKSMWHQYTSEAQIKVCVCV